MAIDNSFIVCLALTIVLSILFFVFNSKDPIRLKDENGIIKTDSNGKIIYEKSVLPLIFGVPALICVFISMCWIASFWM